MEPHLITDLIAAEQKYADLLQQCKQKGAQLFRDARRQFGWSQQDLAELLGCNHTYLSKIENARLKPGKPILIRLGKLLERVDK